MAFSSISSQAQTEEAMVVDLPEVTLSACIGQPVGLRVFAGKSDRVRAHYDSASDRAIYLVGMAAHQSRRDAASLLQWCGDTASSTTHTAFRSLMGQFVILIDDRRRREVRFVSDFLGLRPWFVGSHNGRLVAGNDAMEMAKRGLSAKHINYDAVAAWMKFNYDCTGGSLFDDLNRLAPGVVATFDRRGRTMNETAYAQMPSGATVVPQDQLVAELHDRVSHAFDVMTRDVDEITIPLSGGYDSRYLMAMASQRKMRINAVNIESYTSESIAARRVCEALGTPLNVVPVGGHTLDLFDEPFQFTPAGFPSALNLTSAVVRLHPGVPVVSGYMGDPMIRGTLDCHNGKRVADYSDTDLVDLLVHKHAIRAHRLDLIDPAIARGINERARMPMQAALEEADVPERGFFWSNAGTRQRYYISGLFLQHADVAETMLPFCTWDLCSYKLAHAAECFQFSNYPRLFEMFFPSIAHIPHCSQLCANDPPQRSTRHLRRWSAGLLRTLLHADELPHVCRRKILRRLPGGLLHHQHRQDEILFMHKMQRFEAALREMKLDFSWSRLAEAPESIHSRPLPMPLHKSTPTPDSRRVA